MARVAGCLACLAMLLAMPGLRVLCADSCPPAERSEEPPCHDGRTDSPAPRPGDPADGCAHGDALSSTSARSLPDGAAAGGEMLVASWSLHGRSAVDRRLALAGRPAAPAFSSDCLLLPLRC